VLFNREGGLTAAAADDRCGRSELTRERDCERRSRLSGTTLGRFNAGQQAMVLDRPKRLAQWSLLTAISLSVVLVLSSALAYTINAEFNGRLTETQTVAPKSGNTNGLLVRLTIHKILVDENAVEASLLLVVNGSGEVGKQIQSGRLSVWAEVEDVSSQHLHAAGAETPLIDSSKFMRSEAVAQSQRFNLPSYPSVDAYPFDDLHVRPLVYVRTSQGYILDFALEIQKASPGRLLSVQEEGGIPVAALKRAPTQKLFIIATATLFLLVSVAVTVAIFFGARGASGFEQLVAAASYMLSAAGFKELLGVSAVPGTTVLEIVILGVPLVLVSLGVAFSLYRHYKETA
jgi:hypothetical protein